MRDTEKTLPIIELSSPSDLEKIRISATRAAQQILSIDHSTSPEDIGNEAVRIALTRDKPIENPQPWGFRVGRNLALNVAKSHGRFDPFEEDNAAKPDSGFSMDPSRLADIPAISVAWRDLCGVYRGLVENLPADHKNLFFGRHREGRSCEELACQENLSVVAVRQRLCRIQYRLYCDLLSFIRAWPVGRAFFLNAFSDRECFAERFKTLESSESFEKFLAALRG